MTVSYNEPTSEELRLDLGRRFRQQRLNQGLTIQQLAKQSGVSLRTISAFERGESNISLNNLIELLRVLQLLNALQNLLPEIPLISPLQLIALEKKQRKKARS